MHTNGALRVAIVHDWLTGYRGGERVLEALLELFPDAEVFTLFHTPSKLPRSLRQHLTHVSFLNRIPRVEKYYRYLLPFLPLAIERFDLSRFDLVLSSSHCVAKGVIPAPDALHVTYCHTPMRYAWDRFSDYFGRHPLRVLISAVMTWLRVWDVASSARVDRFIANSQWVRKRIEKYYRREAEVVPPFVDLETYLPRPGDKREDYYLVVSAFAPYKRIDLAIEACAQMGRKLWIVGDGQDDKHLRRLAGPNVRFVGSLEKAELRKVYAAARALLFPGEEDFGITPLEAMASGTPVIAYGRGGAVETVVDGETGVFFAQQTVESLTSAIKRYEEIENTFSRETCRRRAEYFSKARFQTDIIRLLEEWLTKRPALGGNLRPSPEPSFPN